MGAALYSAAQWTSAEERCNSKLEHTPFNEILLKDMIDFVKGISCKRFDERHFAFEYSLTWITEIKPSDLPAKYKKKGSEVVSKAVDKSGRPLLVMKLKDVSWEISVRCFKQLNVVFESARSRKLLEAKRCLEANPDPVTRILGTRLSTVGRDAQEIHCMVQDLLARECILSKAELKEQRTVIDIVYKIKALDDFLMIKANTTISGLFKLNPEEVDREFHELTKCCDQDPRLCAVKAVSWLEPHTFVFKNGCRAPIWRQSSGDISYLVAQPHVGDPIYITASTRGYYVNGGMQTNTKVLDFDKKSVYYKDLQTLLLKEKARFDSIIENQDVFKSVESKVEDRTGQTSPVVFRVKSIRKLVDAANVNSVVRLPPGNRANTPLEMTQTLTGILSGEESREEKKLRGDDGSSDGSDDDAEVNKSIDKSAMLSDDYWLIHKYMKIMKGGKAFGTALSLSMLMYLDLNKDSFQLGIRDFGGVELLVNLMESKDRRCQIGALRVLKKISGNRMTRQLIADLGGIQVMVRLLRCRDSELRCLAAEAIAHIAQFKRERRIVRLNNSIGNLVAMLDICCDRHTSSTEELNEARCAALALLSCCKSHSNRTIMHQADIIAILGKLLSRSDPEILIPIVGILCEFAQDPVYMFSIWSEGILGGIVKHLRFTKSIELQTVCARMLSVCAREEESCDVIRGVGGLNFLVDIIADTRDKKLLEAATGAIWKCAFNEECCKVLSKLLAVTHLVRILNAQPEEPEEVLINVVGALGEMAKVKVNAKEIRQVNGIPPLVTLLKKTNTDILINASKAVGFCAGDLKNMALINELGGVSLIWSLIKSNNEKVQTSAALALDLCLQCDKPFQFFEEDQPSPEVTVDAVSKEVIPKQKPAELPTTAPHQTDVHKQKDPSKCSGGAAFPDKVATGCGFCRWFKNIFCRRRQKKCIPAQP